jgi:hypothetical protein
LFAIISFYYFYWSFKIYFCKRLDSLFLLWWDSSFIYSSLFDLISGEPSCWVLKVSFYTIFKFFIIFVSKDVIGHYYFI